MAVVKLIVKEVAERKGVTNPFQLSQKTGLNYAACYKLWHEEQKMVGLKTLAIICQTFNVKPGQLFEFQVDEPT